MKCKKCKFAKFESNKRNLQCLQLITEMKPQCLLRHLYWLIISNKQLGAKAEKLIDKTIEEMNEGEEWKKPQ